MEGTWGNSTLHNFTSHYVPRDTIVRSKEMHQILHFICGCCSDCAASRSSGTQKTDSRIMHIAALPGSGKTMLLQQLLMLTNNAKRTSAMDSNRKAGEKAKKRGPGKIDSDSSLTCSRSSNMCPHSHICMISCASKNWNNFLQSMIESLEEIKNERNAQTVKVSKKKLSEELTNRLVAAISSFHGVVILDEIDTIITRSRSSNFSVDSSQFSLETIAAKRRKTINRSQILFDPLNFLFQTFQASRTAGLVIISNHLNMHAQHVIQSSTRNESIQKMILKAYSKDDIREIIVNRCGTAEVFEPAALNLLVNMSCDARRVLNIALEAMLHSRRQHWNDPMCSLDPAKQVGKSKKNLYPLVTVSDITNSCSDSGDIMLRQIRTILTPLSKDLQLLLVGIIHLSKLAFTSSRQGNSVITITSLYRWIFEKGMELVKLQDVYDDRMFQKGINSLCDFNFIRYISPNLGNYSMEIPMSARRRHMSSLTKIKGTIALQYDTKALKIAIQALLRDGASGRESFQATVHLLEE